MHARVTRGRIVARLSTRVGDIWRAANSGRRPEVREIEDIAKRGSELARNLRSAEGVASVR